MQMADNCMPTCPGQPGCNGDSHGKFTFTVKLVTGTLNGILRFRRTCVDCGSQEDFNTRGEIERR